MAALIAMGTFEDESKSCISLIDELLLVLVKVHLSVPNHDLGYQRAQ